MVQSSVLGFPRMGVLRDLKKATEAYWGGKISQEELLKEGKRLRLAHWKIQKDAGVDIIPSNDFAYYDQVRLSITCKHLMVFRRDFITRSRDVNAAPWAYCQIACIGDYATFGDLPDNLFGTLSRRQAKDVVLEVLSQTQSKYEGMYSSDIDHSFGLTPLSCTFLCAPLCYD